MNARDRNTLLTSAPVVSVADSVPSLAVRPTRKWPPAAYACVVSTPEPTPPSPNAQAKVSASPSGSEDPDALIAIRVPTNPEYGPPALATGARSTPETVTLTETSVETAGFMASRARIERV